MQFSIWSTCSCLSGLISLYDYSRQPVPLSQLSLSCLVYYFLYLIYYHGTNKLSVCLIFCLFNCLFHKNRINSRQQLLTTLSHPIGHLEAEKAIGPGARGNFVNYNLCYLLMVLLMCKQYKCSKNKSGYKLTINQTVNLHFL